MTQQKTELIRRDPDSGAENDFVLEEDACVWIEVGGLVVYIQQGIAGIRLEVVKSGEEDGEPLAATEWISQP